MPDALRTASPPADWRSFKFTCELSGGMEGIKTAQAADVAALRHSYLYLVNDTVLAVQEDVAVGEEGVGYYHAEKIMVPKMIESIDIFLPGMRVYWDPTTRLVTPAATSGYYWIGIATEPAAAADLRVEIDLKGERTEAEAAL